MTGEKERVRIIPIGGLGAIGKNMTIYEYGDDIVIVDCGIMFPREGMLGIDYLIPDLSYVIANRDKIRGIIVTHGHEDHLGAVPHLLQEIDAPLYATRLTLGLIKSRLEERPPKKEPNFIEISPRDVVHIGPFIFEFISMNHSIVDSVGLAIQTPVGNIIHTGDFKIDLAAHGGGVTDIYRLADYGERGVLLLLSDSTNAEVEGYTGSETALNKRIVEMFGTIKGRIIVASFASNISRIQQIMDTAKRYNRKIVISGLTMQKNIEIAGSLGYLDFKDDLIVDLKTARNLPEKKQVILCTGTQGEPMSALSRIAAGTHKHFAAGPGDVVIITASVIPGNEQMVGTVINSLMRNGADVFYERNEDIHVSGHASKEDLKMMISLTKPKFFIPIHGEYKHMKAHVQIAKEMKIKPTRIKLSENGDIIELSEKNIFSAGSLDLDEIFVDRKSIGYMTSGIITERQIMSTDGIILVTLCLSRGGLAAPPEAIVRGLVEQEAKNIAERVVRETENHVETMLADGVPPEQIGPLVRKNVKSAVSKMSKRRPIVEVQVIGV